MALALLFLLPVIGSCATTVQPVAGTDFYEALLKRQSGAETEATALFKRALDSPNHHIAAAAAAELLGQYLTIGAEFSAETWTLIGSVATGPWACAFRVLNSPSGREETLALLLSRSTGNPVLHAMSDWLWATPDGLAFTDAENAAISGRVAASRMRHRDALSFFRVVLDESPGLFFRHPDLLSDLGRAFQFTATGREGIDLFLEW